MEKQCFRKRRIPIFIKHGIVSLIFISLYYLLDYGLMRIVLLIQLIVLIKDLRLCVYIEEGHLFYRTLFRTRAIPIQQIRRILFARKTTFTEYGSTVNYYFHVHIKTEDVRNSLLWEIPNKVIPTKERNDFTRRIKHLNPSVSINLVTPMHTE